MIVGTAGHIDHGKSTLVRALTGVDTDRLPEEKQRGISIELGYAFLDVPGCPERIGFVDVPGHERLVHTMISGATGIHFALLLVAADDGPMPQTREHLAVLSLLGLSRGAVVVTKADRADAARVSAVCAEAAALLHGTSLAGAPVLAVSAHSGEGLDALRTLLFDAARALPPRHEADAAFRLAVDRTFTLTGVGTVVTGTVHAGTVTVGDTLRLVPGDREARVRSLHAQNQAVTQAGAGQRCAVALVGLAREDIRRGQWLVAPATALATDRLDAELTLWHEEARPMRSGQAVHVHLGAAAVPGTVAVLDGDTLAPGERARVQIVLREPVGAWHGDRIVLRDASASRCGVRR
jgi:selenocysteine-specific elongation factor